MDTQQQPRNRKVFIAGWVVSAVAALAMLASAAMKLSMNPEFLAAFTSHLGYPAGTLVPIGIVELTVTALYLFPRTRVLGALLLTAYLGGATATHVRIGESFAVPVVIGALVWLGLYLRDPILRRLVPLVGRD